MGPTLGAANRKHPASWPDARGKIGERMFCSVTSVNSYVSE